MNNSIGKTTIDEYSNKERMTGGAGEGKKVILTNGEGISLKLLVDAFLDDPAFILPFPPDDRTRIMSFLMNNGMGLVVRQLQEEILKE